MSQHSGVDAAPRQVGRERLSVVAITGRVLAGLVLAGLALAGCAGPTGTSAESASPTPTAACPSLPDVPDSSRDCAVYDPDEAMAQNDRYREQLPLDAATRARLDELVEPARAALEALPVPPTLDAVRAALVSLGIVESEVQLRGGHGTGVAFGASGGGGCLNGAITEAGEVTVETGGYILDGGCLPAQ